MLVQFDEVLQAFKFINADRFFNVGDCTFERQDGLAMGQATSPAITAFDLDWNSRRMYGDKYEAERVGTRIPGMATTRVIQALLHVDDALVCSKALCCNCLATTIRLAWPADVEPKIEESGYKIGFLHCTITAEERSIYTNKVTYTVQTPNINFTKGKTTTPRMAKFQQFVSSNFQTKRQLQSILWGKISIAVNTCRQDVQHVREYVVSTTTEAILMGWNPQHVGQALAALPKSHRGKTACFIRLLGQTMRKSYDLMLAWSHDYSPTTWLSFPWFRLIDNISEFVLRRMSVL
jgi:hypothetical protein